MEPPDLMGRFIASLRPFQLHSKHCLCFAVGMMDEALMQPEG